MRDLINTFPNAMNKVFNATSGIQRMQRIEVPISWQTSSYATAELQGYYKGNFSKAYLVMEWSNRAAAAQLILDGGYKTACVYAHPVGTQGYKAVEFELTQYNPSGDDGLTIDDYLRFNIRLWEGESEYLMPTLPNNSYMILEI